jgi:hypothetical protein
MIPKDWAREAANHIWDIAWKHHGVAPPESQIAAIIKEHCPFEPDVTYMPVPRCDSCCYWRPGPDAYGACNLSGSGSEVYGGAGEDIRTLPGWGCVRWEAK